MKPPQKEERLISLMQRTLFNQTQTHRSPQIYSYVTYYHFIQQLRLFLTLGTFTALILNKTDDV